MTLQRILLATVATVALTATAAQASELITAGQRVANETGNQALGVRAGGFLVVPKVDLEETYNDNIYATQNNAKNDYVTTVRPEVLAKSNWSRHALNARANMEWNKYANHDAEDNTNYLGAVDGRLDVMKETSIGGGVSYAKDHEDRGDPNSVASSVKPTEYTTTTGKIGAYRGLGRFNARIDSEAKKLNYRNGYTGTGGLVNNNLRDRTEWTQSGRVGYQATPGTELFIKGSTDTRAYNFKGSSVDANRSSHGNEVVGGVDIDLTGKTKAEAFAGYVHRNYVEASRKDVSEPTFGGKVTWNASDLTTVTGGVKRTVEETILATSSSYLHDSYAAGVEHALTRNLVLNGDVDYSNNDYKGFAANQREDNIWTLAAGAKYYINHCLTAKAGYTFRDRDSNQAGGDYDRNVFLIGLTGTY